MPYEGKTDWKRDDVVRPEDMNRIEQGLKDAHVPAYQPLTMTPGLQVIESEQDVPFQMGEIKGWTLINLLGRDGNFDYRSSPLFTFFGTGEIVEGSTPVGSKCQKIVCNRTDTAHFGARYELNIDRAKHYVAVAYLENVSCDVPVYFSLAEWKSTGYSSIRRSGNVNKGNGMIFRYVSISPADMSPIQEKLIFYFRGEGTAGAEFRIGAFGLYEISQSEYEAISSMKYDYVAERYPYVDSMTNVKNPYAIVTGGNLLPPFTEWETEPNAMAIAVSPYEAVAEITSDGTKAPLRTIIPVLPNTVYTVSSEGNAIPANGLQIIERKDGKVGEASGEISGGYFDNVPGKVAVGTVTFTTTAQTHYLAVRLRFDKAGTYTINKPMIMPTTEPKPFTKQQRSMIAFEAELAAHPLDGSNPDTLFMGDDGVPYVNEMWGKVTLDGNMKYLLAHNGGDFRTFFTETLPPTVKDTAYITKYDGKMLARRLLGQSITEGDTQVLTDSTDVNPNRSVFSVFNTDSGWGPDYKLTEDDIKAYFLGWKMYHVESNDYKSVYNGTGTKRWVSLTDWSTLSPVGVTPSDMAPGYTPYRLQYLKAKPTVEPVRNYEMGATLSAGSNMVEVGSGIVIRERANPVVNYINAINAGGGLKYKTTNLLAVYRNQTRDFGWTFKDGVWDGEPYQYAENPIPALANAIYHVTYTMLDPTLAAPISGTVAANLRGTISDLVQDVGDIGRRLSVVENGKADAVEDTGWILSHR
ncbi:hypothetical protein FLT15_06975 [Paenibacillus thiaminolyticus]|uniref:hypothetical protein n=1 Tax=Paenibacillus thiaminolyticus TaxID=49283 RepID=UPI001164694E|nr:hypothetical protein [Paenibacillus thiaminolyticus]NGP58141.1 hypothetical protein [Paenibacillus thiaminolyticus]